MKTYDFGQKTESWEIKSPITSIPKRHYNGVPIKFVIWKDEKGIHYEGYEFESGRWIKKHETRSHRF